MAARAPPRRLPPLRRRARAAERDRRGRSPLDARRGRGVHRRGLRRDRPADPRDLTHVGLLPDTALAPRPRHRALRGRTGRRGGRRKPLRRRGRSGPHRARHRTARRRGRSRTGAGPRRAGDPRRGRRQRHRRPPVRARRRRRRDGSRGGPGRRTLPGASQDTDGAGTQGRGRELRPADPNPRSPLDHPGAGHRARRAGRNPVPAGEPRPGLGAGRGRRVRRQDGALPRGGLPRGGRAAARPAGQVVRRPPRGSARHHPGVRRGAGDRARPRRGRAHRRARSRRDLRRGLLFGLSLDRLHRAGPGGELPAGPLPGRELPGAGAVGDDAQAGRRSLSRRRAADLDLRHGAHDGHGGARARPRPGRDPPPQHDRRRRVPLPHGVRHRLGPLQLPRLPGDRVPRDRLRQAARRAGGSEGGRPSGRHRRSRPTRSSPGSARVSRRHRGCRSTPGRKPPRSRSTPPAR